MYKTRIFTTIFLTSVLVTPVFAQEIPKVRPGLTDNTPLVIEEQGTVLVDGQLVPLNTVIDQNMGYFLPDGKGGLVWSKSEKARTGMKPSYIDAREIKLQVRELAEQLLANIQQTSLRGKIALPTSFVNQDDFEQTSSFGRYIAEQMFHEFNQRGFPSREYRISGQKIRMIEDTGDFYLSRAKGDVTALDKTNVVLVGTYYFDDKNVFINARLIRPSDGYVYRTAQMVMPLTPTTKTMLAKSSRRLESGTMQIVSKQWATEEKANIGKSRGGASGNPGQGGSNVDVLDQGYDVH